MLSYIKKQTVTITIGVSFFVFGFFIVANLLKLTERDVLVGLISGAVGGVTMLATSLGQERRARERMPPGPRNPDSPGRLNGGRASAPMRPIVPLDAAP